jgi:hypothetical protein
MATYEADFHAWAYDQANKLRAGEPVDIANIAEELETLGRTEEQQLTNRLAVLIQYLLKCEYQPQRRTPSWDATIKEHRQRVARLLDRNPSLKAKLTVFWTPTPLPLRSAALKQEFLKKTSRLSARTSLSSSCRSTPRSARSTEFAFAHVGEPSR